MLKQVQHDAHVVGITILENMVTGHPENPRLVTLNLFQGLNFHRHGCIAATCVLSARQHVSTPHFRI
ncbi:hypothetical protein [Sphingorhabdus sp.]|jgi:hypothetical protein|uniref:hypothetical protein n=1 Tax=Sphingorhabdus sp. TaxID=1902408 RepID=UPI0037C58A2C